MKLHEFKIAYVVAAWVLVAVVIIISLSLWNSSGFSTNLDLLSKVITFVLAPLAVLSAWVSFAQWKVQSDREAGYEHCEHAEVRPAVGKSDELLV